LNAKNLQSLRLKRLSLKIQQRERGFTCSETPSS
jgi:hypothetical protein